MAAVKLTKNELKAQKDALKMYRRYLPTLTLKKQQLQTEIRTIDERAKEVRAKRKALDTEFKAWIAVFGEADVFTDDMVQVHNIRKGTGNIAGVVIPVYEGADFTRGDYDLYKLPLWVDLAAVKLEQALSLDLEAEVFFRNFSAHNGSDLLVAQIYTDRFYVHFCFRNLYFFKQINALGCRTQFSG